MLVLPNDSGYDSPCDGVYPSSFALSPSKLLPDMKRQICRKLDFGTRLCSNTGYDVTSTDCKCRAREIASRLILMCDLFDYEFAQFHQQEISWTVSMLRSWILNNVVYRHLL